MKHDKNRQHIEYQTNHDLLTHLPCHRRLSTDADVPLVPGVMGIAVLSLGLDAFRCVNEGLGRAVGDQVLQVITGRLKMSLRQGQRLGRSNGDIFTIVAPDCDIDVAVQLVQRMQLVIKQPLVVGEHLLRISACAGIAFCPALALTPAFDADLDLLLEDAQIAMYKAKTQGHGSHCFFRLAMRQQACDRLAWVLALQHALAENRLQLHYQPQVCLSSGQLHGVEALARWHDPRLGVISPEFFIGLLQEMGEIENFGRWVLRAACIQMALWRANGLYVPTISVNLCALSFRDSELPAYIKKLLQTFSLNGNHLILEITESTAIVINPAMLQTMHNIRDLGVGLSIDDFGTGFSSLSNLFNLPITELKIDRSFIDKCVQDDRYRLLVLALIDLGRDLHLNVVAEGVENDAQRHLLLQQKCPIAQGYLFSPPLEPQAIAQWLGQ